MTAAPASRARYCAPPISASAPSWSNRFFKVTGLAIWPRSMSLPIAAKMRPWTALPKCSGSRNSDDPGIGGVVDQDRAEQRLFGIGVVGRGADQRGVGVAQRRDPRSRRRFHDARLPPAGPDRPAQKDAHPVEGGDRQAARSAAALRSRSHRACSRGRAAPRRPPWRAASGTPCARRAGTRFPSRRDTSPTSGRSARRRSP